MPDKPKPRLSLRDWDYFHLLTKLLRKPRSRSLRESLVRALRRLDIREPANRVKHLVEGDRRAWAQTLIEAVNLPGGGLFVHELYHLSPFRDHLFAIIGPDPDRLGALQISGHGEPVIAALFADPVTAERYAFPPYYFVAVRKP